jgi:acyl-CoA reductase-like NAD-dependent aldehyde dehydrogenase
MALTAPPLELLPPAGLLIGGERAPGDGEHEHVYPATGQVTAPVAIAGAASIDAAVRAAADAAPRWRRLTGAQRRTLLLALADRITADSERLAGLQTIENGMPAQFARGLPAVAADFVAYYAGWADKLGGELVDTWPVAAHDYVVDEPYGVVGIIVPWNAPLVSLAQVAAAALAAGNAVVVKPPELAPFSALRMGELALEAGLPPGVLNVVPGGPAGGAALVRHAGVGKLHFTGSVETGRDVLDGAREQLTPVALELGGKSAQIVFADGDVRAAARQALTGIVVFSGQGCANGTRVLVQSSVYDEVLELATRRLARLPLGDPLAPGTVLGPVVSAGACERILGIVERARTSGAGRLVTGGERVDGDLADGFFVAPTVFGEVDPASELAQREIFGPVLSFMRFETEDEAVELANATPYGLAAYVNTLDVRRAHRTARRLEAGNVWVNGFFGVPPSMSFGGMKHSGSGRAGGRAGLREFLRSKNVWMAL